LEVATRFVETTGVDVFAPAIGDAHGMYRLTVPELDSQRISDLVVATGIPMALHGGSGLTPDQFRDLIGQRCAKVNISTALKVAYLKSSLERLEEVKVQTRSDRGPTRGVTARGGVGS
jgi:fructose-bisphosphate aldolase class II